MVTPKAGRITTSSGVSASMRLALIAEEANALRTKLVVDVRVVDDFAGQEDGAVREAAPRLVGVVDGAIDAVAEAELAREMDGEPARRRTGNRTFLMASMTSLR